jgi:hypothetical protein
MRGGVGLAARSLPPPVTLTLEAFSRQHGIEPARLLAGAWAVVLRRYSREETVVFGAVLPRQIALPRSRSSWKSAWLPTPGRSLAAASRHRAA